APPAPPAEPAPEPAAEEPVTSYIAPDATRSRIPIWVMPVLAALPFWGILYVGAFGERAKKQVGDPGQVAYAASGCGSCHGTRGEGGAGPALAGGQSKLTFPNEADHANWIKTGSAPFAGKPYGDPNRPGGQRGPASGGMPAFGSLSDAELKALVAYERDKL
ncbi:MAG: cytochrome c, partial [Actinomycetota bacterium]|nr:cytochrome c [Actinomycetota bacterium]